MLLYTLKYTKFRVCYTSHLRLFQPCSVFAHCVSKMPSRRMRVCPALIIINIFQPSSDIFEKQKRTPFNESEAKHVCQLYNFCFAKLIKYENTKKVFRVVSRNSETMFRFVFFLLNFV